MTDDKFSNRDEAVAWAAYNDVAGGGVTVAQWRERMDQAAAKVVATRALQAQPLTADDASRELLAWGLHNEERAKGLSLAQYRELVRNTSDAKRTADAQSDTNPANANTYNTNRSNQGQFPGPASSAPYPSNDEQVVRSQQRQIDSANLAASDVNAPPLAQHVPQPTPSVGTTGDPARPHGKSR